MKSCPTCHSTYPSDFALCPRDGASLVESGGWAEGMLIRGKYLLLAQLPPGGMAIVYKALHQRFNELRALKVMKPDLAADQSFVKRFMHEAVITRRLQHPNAVRVEDIDEAEDGRPFIVMEYIEGRSLKEVIGQEAPLAVPRVCSIVKQVASALDAAHRLGMIHRDIKPANIVLVSADGVRQPSSVEKAVQPEGKGPTSGVECAKVLDFGIAKIKEAHLEDSRLRLSTVTDSGMVVGTPAYMSPEQAMGKRGEDLDGRADLYSLGIVMYQMLTGELPLKADSGLQMLMAQINTAPPDIRTRRRDIPEPIAALVMQCLEKDRIRRPASAHAVIEQIEYWEDEPVRLGRAKAARERVAREQAEAKRADQDKAERERLERELAEAAARIKAGRERAEAEQAEREKAERERLAREEAEVAAKIKAEREQAQTELAESEKSQRERLAQETSEAEPEANANAAREPAETEVAKRNTAQRERQTQDMAETAAEIKAEPERRPRQCVRARPAAQLHEADAGAENGSGPTSPGWARSEAPTIRKTSRLSTGDASERSSHGSWMVGTIVVLAVLSAICWYLWPVAPSQTDQPSSAVPAAESAAAPTPSTQPTASGTGLALSQGAIAFDPSTDGASDVGQAETLADNGKWKAAIPWFRQAIRVNPDSREAHQQLGLALLQVGDLKGAISEEREAVRLDPSDLSAQSVLTDVSRKAKDLEKFRSLHATVTSLRFYPASSSIVPYGRRHYRDGFVGASTRYVFWELCLSNPSPDKKTGFTIDATLVNPNGNVSQGETTATWVEPSWTGSCHTNGWGWTGAGHWAAGRYIVQLSVGGVRLAKKSFDVY